MKLSNVILEFKVDFEIKGIGITYTDYGRFYGIYLYDKPATSNMQWKEKIRYHDGAVEFIKDLTGLDLPKSYDVDVLDQIVDALIEKGYKADHNDAMDVS